MRLFDILLMVLIVGGAAYYLYRSLLKKEGCSCSSDSCPYSKTCDTKDKAQVEKK